MSRIIDAVSAVVKRRRAQQSSADNHGPGLRGYWSEIEECRLLERIRTRVAETNRRTGYHILEQVEFMPPHETLARVACSKEQTEFVMKITIRDDGPELVFYSQSETSHSGKRTVAFSKAIHLSKVRDEDLQSWFTYLLSGFDKSLIPDSPKP